MIVAAYIVVYIKLARTVCMRSVQDTLFKCLEVHCYGICRTLRAACECCTSVCSHTYILMLWEFGHLQLVHIAQVYSWGKLTFATGRWRDRLLVLSQLWLQLHRAFQPDKLNDCACRSDGADSLRGAVQAKSQVRHIQFSPMLCMLHEANVLLANSTCINLWHRAWLQLQDSWRHCISHQYKVPASVPVQAIIFSTSLCCITLSWFAQGACTVLCCAVLCRGAAPMILLHMLWQHMWAGQVLGRAHTCASILAAVMLCCHCDQSVTVINLCNTTCVWSFRKWFMRTVLACAAVFIAFSSVNGFG